ncbi:Acyl-[acyl-carrier-protein]--UDP-N-acetylglucosamine O-acyltransferase [compost metagenome]
MSYAGINSVGLRRRGFSSEKINEIQEIYRVLFVKHNNVTKALDMIEAEFAPTEIRDEIVDFIRNSNRGVMKGFGSGS